MTVFVLINAIYVNAPWQTAFDAKMKHGETFHLITVSVHFEPH